MRVVDAEHAPTCRIVQRQRVADTVRTVGVGWHMPSHNLHPEAAADLGEEAVEIEESLETLVAPTYFCSISDTDNKYRVAAGRHAVAVGSHFSSGWHRRCILSRLMAKPFQ